MHVLKNIKPQHHVCLKTGENICDKQNANREKSTTSDCDFRVSTQKCVQMCCLWLSLKCLPSCWASPIIVFLFWPPNVKLLDHLEAKWRKPCWFTLTHKEKCWQTHMHMKRDLKGRYHKLFRAHPAAILQHGGRQDAARHLRHLIAHAELKLLDERVGLVICTPHLKQKKVWYNRKKRSLMPFNPCSTRYSPVCWSPPVCLVLSERWLWSWSTSGCLLVF